MYLDTEMYSRSPNELVSFTEDPYPGIKESTGRESRPMPVI